MATPSSLGGFSTLFDFGLMTLVCKVFFAVGAIQISNNDFVSCSVGMTVPNSNNDFFSCSFGMTVPNCDPTSFLGLSLHQLLAVSSGSSNKNNNKQK